MGDDFRLRSSDTLFLSGHFVDDINLHLSECAASEEHDPYDTGRHVVDLPGDNEVP